MSKKSPAPRKEIDKFAPYVPGRSIEEVKAEFGFESIIKLASNENLWGCSPRVIDTLRNNLDMIHYYPQSSPVSLISKIAEKTLAPPESVIVGNGTDEIIELIAKTFLGQKDNIVISENSFVRYKMAGMLMGCEIIEVPQKEFSIDLGAMLSKINRNTKVVFIDNPCNPTGRFIPRFELEHFLSNIKILETPPLIVADEAYYEYVKDRKFSTALDYIGPDVPIMVLRTFSKIYGLAGLRIGYGISAPEIIANMNKIRPPFNTNRLAQVAAEAAIEDTEFINAVSIKTSDEKQYLYRELDRIGLEYVRSETNFILVKFPGHIIDDLCSHLLSKGIILRPLGGYNIKDHIRITVGKREHNRTLIENIEQYVKEFGEVGETR